MVLTSGDIILYNIIFATRNPKDYGLEEISKYIQFGASPRATIDMMKGAKALAFLRGKDFVSPVDIAFIAKDILRHRIILTYDAEANDITTEQIIEKILGKVDIP